MPVKAIAAEGWYGNEHIETLKIPESVIEIGPYAFMECSNLTTLYLPEALDIIGEYAFESCPNLKTIYYAGTVERWTGLTYGSAFGADPIELHCSDGTVTIKFGEVVP